MWRLLDELEQCGQLVRVRQLVDPHLELAEIQRRAYAHGSPALLFENVKGSPFPALANLYGTEERCRILFKSTWDAVRLAIGLKANPAEGAMAALSQVVKNPRLAWRLPWAALCARPIRIPSAMADVLRRETSLSELPQIKSWPEDGGAFVTLPQVCSEDPAKPGVMGANLGMYRIQISGNDFKENEEVGLHYQIHRGLGIHHTHALESGEDLKVSIFIGGHPAHAFAAVMPLPEGLSELMFAGMLAGRPFRYARHEGWLVAADADFCILGTMAREEKPEGPFGDHLGYYSLAHKFPYLKVHKVYCRERPVYPFTVVGRPPQEDTTFGKMIHELTKPMVPVSLPGVKALHAVDAAGVHPLLLAIGKERYLPSKPRRPLELLTQACAILGFNQCSLAKYLFIANISDDPMLSADDIEGFFHHILARIHFDRDLHFLTRTTIDTLDYSGQKMHEGSKLIIAVAGAEIRELSDQQPKLELPPAFTSLRVVSKGILALGVADRDKALADLQSLKESLSGLEGFALLVLVDDAEFVAADFTNFLWVTFTRSNPSHDIYGPAENIENKHWSCAAPMIIDALKKPHHAPELIEDPEVSKSVDAFMSQNQLGI